MNRITQVKIEHCRVCQSTLLETVLLLPKMPFADQFIKKQDIGKEFLGNIEIGICKNCGSVQNLNDTEMTEYYNDYTYTVQSSNFAMKFMKSFAEQLHKIYLTDVITPKVLEIGSGSGEQLREFKELGCEVLGIEPSKKLSDYANSVGVKTITGFFDENTQLEAETFDLVISSYTFDHIPQPQKTLMHIHRILKNNGILAIEIHDLELIKKRNEFCLFEHEHYIYLNKNTTANLFNSTGFEILTFDLLPTAEKRANSLIAVAQKKQQTIKHDYLVQKELNEITPLSSCIYNSISNIENWLEKNKHLKLVAYGAGRGTVTLAAIRNPETVCFIVDKNPKMSDIYAPKSHIPVFSIDWLGKEKIDIIIIFSFGYMDEIIREVTEKYNYKKEQFISILDILN